MRVGAWLEVDVQRAIPRALAGGFQSLLLRVPMAGLAVEALAHDKARGVQYDSADHRVGAGPVVRLARELNGARRPLQVYVSVAICVIQFWHYTRAESNHRVIDNRKVYENLQCQSAGSIDVNVCVRPARARLPLQ